jgi:SAM-dependent methyltransferase
VSTDIAVDQLGAYAQRNLDLATPRGSVPMRASEPDVFRTLQAKLDELLPQGRTIRILNAGCGTGMRYVPVASDRAVVGIDVEDQPPGASVDVDERLIGDIETYDFGARRFDVVYCWDVLEHIPDPHLALRNLISTLDPGGLVILGLPHAASVKGVITRLTPHWVHRWLWRTVLHSDRPEDEKAEPFPTVLSKAMTPAAIRAFARSEGLAIELCCEYEAWPQKKIRTLLRVRGRLFALLAGAARVLSLGRVTAHATDVVFLLRRPL